MFATGATEHLNCPQMLAKDKTWQPEKTYIDVVNPCNQVNQKHNSGQLNKQKDT